MRRDESPGSADEPWPGDAESGLPASGVPSLEALREEIRARERGFRSEGAAPGERPRRSSRGADRAAAFGGADAFDGAGARDRWTPDDQAEAPHIGSLFADGDSPEERGPERKRRSRRGRGGSGGGDFSEEYGPEPGHRSRRGRGAFGEGDLFGEAEPEGERRSRRGRGAARGEEFSVEHGPPADPEAAARAICLRLLTMAPKTRAQLAEALRKREVPEEAAQAVLERFSEVGLIDDEAFAAAWVSSRHAGRGLARRALAQELRHRGVDEDTVNEAVDQLDPEQEVETARRLVARKLSGTRGLDPQTRTRRLVGMLARKGYGPGLAFRVVREALEGEGSEVDDSFDGDLR
ncbi:recombination regulator RecX [Microtetraspora malaysiensis]|uniref:recombination regulator RecX n=1 Tax=Microtetraspora malaysiensis TaxID=161358 RepID=UPI003D91C5C9